MEHLTIIKPSKGWVMVNTRELWHYKDLLYFLTMRGIKAKYAQSVLGIGVGNHSAGCHHGGFSQSYLAGWLR
jgi:hypothetical protein